MLLQVFLQLTKGQLSLLTIRGTTRMPSISHVEFYQVCRNEMRQSIAKLLAGESAKEIWR